MKKKEINNFIYWLIVLIPFFKTDYLSQFEVINNIFTVWKIGAILFSIIMFLNNKKLTKKLFIIIIFVGWLSLVTIFNKGNVQQCLLYAITLISLTIFFENGIKQMRPFFSALLLCFEVVIYINFITLIFFPGGLYISETTTYNWFLGYDNTHIVYYLPAALIALLYQKITKKKLRVVLIISVIIVSAIIRWSATTIVGLTIFFAFIFLPIIKKNTKIFNHRNYMIMIVIIFVSMVIMRLQDYFSFIIVDILDKDLTFANRTPLWDTTIQYIQRNPILGYGWQNNDIRHLMYNSSSVITAHNQILEYLYLGGMTLISIYMYICMYINKITKKNRKEPIIQYITVAFFAVQILQFSEVYINPLFNIIIIIALYSDKILEYVNNKIGEKSVEKNINNSSSSI